MFDDFDENAKQQEGRGRMGASLGLSLVIFGGLALLVGSAVADQGFGEQQFGAPGVCSARFVLEYLHQ